MQELSLHLLDLLENAVRAGASTIRVRVEEDATADRLVLAVEDDGPGFPVTEERVLDPFFTTQQGKRTGLGISLLKAAAEQAGGSLRLGRSEWGGASVEAELQLSHLDRAPLGDLGATVLSILWSHPGLEIRCRIRCGSRECEVDAARPAEELGTPDPGGLEVARRMAERIRRALDETRVTA